MRLLVHVYTPSSKSDDDRRCQQAQAYLAFEPWRHHDIHVLRKQSDGQAAASLLLLLDGTQSAATALESQLFTPSDGTTQSVVAAPSPLALQDARPSAHDRSTESTWSSSPDVPDRLPSTYSVTDDSPDVSTPGPRHDPPLQDDEQIRRALAHQPTSIHPPLPPTRSSLFVTHTTPALESLVRIPSLSDRYTPTKTHRRARTSERGFWAFDTSAWTPSAQLDFWAFMLRVVQAGSVGWAVWCARQPRRDTLGVVRVFCWGEVVAHVYLLLYVASKSRIRRIPCAWMDAGERLVIQM